jgi:hypothetical protein
MANSNRVALQYLPPVMVIIGLCSMNDKMVPFTFNKAGFIIITMLVILSFVALSHMMSHIHEDSKWRTEILCKPYEMVLTIIATSQSVCARCIAFARQRFGRTAQERPGTV